MVSFFNHFFGFQKFSKQSILALFKKKLTFLKINKIFIHFFRFQNFSNWSIFGLFKYFLKINKFSFIFLGFKIFQNDRLWGYSKKKNFHSQKNIKFLHLLDNFQYFNLQNFIMDKIGKYVNIWNYYNFSK